MKRNRNRQSILWRLFLLGLLVIPMIAVKSHVDAQDNRSLRLAGPLQGPETLDPAQLRDVSGMLLYRQIFRGLMYYDNELNPVPELAASYAVSDDGLRYDFIIRDGATFQNGDPIDASDVSFSLARSVDPDTTVGDVSLLAGVSYLSDIDGFADVVAGDSDELSGVTVVSDRELTITLSAPRSTFLMKLATVPASIVDKDQVESDSTWWSHPNGSGPYRVENWDPDKEMDLVRYDDFILGKPEVEHINVRLGTRSLQSFNLYQSGEIDVDSISLADIDRVTDPVGPFADELITTPQFGFGYIFLNQAIAPLDDPEIRAALQLAFPRTEVAEILFNGWVQPADGLIPDGMLERTWDSKVANENLDEARAAIGRSTYGSPENVPPIRIYASGATAAEVLRSVAKDELGLTIEVFDLEWSDFLDRINSEDVPAAELFWSADYPDPAGILLPMWGTGQPDNYSGYSNPVVDELLEQASSETDVNIRASLYDKINGIVISENVVIPVFVDVQYTVAQEWVTNLTVTPIGILRLETVQIES